MTPSEAGANSEGSEGEDVFVDLLDEFLSRKRAGEEPTIEEYCARYPNHAERIRKVFPAVDRIEGVRPEVDEELQESIGRPSTRLREVGPYRILGEIGRGGMGVVYKAEHVHLGRRVALKVLSTGRGGSLTARFRVEARAAARLHHTNIVPVFDVGQDGERLFYAMQLIEGQSLDDFVRNEIITLFGRIFFNSIKDSAQDFYNSTCAAFNTKNNN